MAFVKNTRMGRKVNLACFAVGFSLSCIFLLIERTTSSGSFWLTGYFILLFLLIASYAVFLSVINVHNVRFILRNERETGKTETGTD
jgi:hypothetical protein